ncbi:C40 family peptidase [Oceanobacillus manasiensis]|uniref:C40 family peptidase n=1 Tax=Oceanobacillus manasiensis TaxID=586413 RepID=UPI0005A966FB|nr:C40 family peptidase [Oceanobacillus manasiensis]
MVKQSFDQFSNTLHVTAVQVATVWTSPDSARAIDKLGVTVPADMQEWINGLTYEQNLALCEENRVQSQLLYGQPVIITETQGDWAHVVIPDQPSKKDERGYPGWMPHAQLREVNKSDWQSEHTAAVSSKKAWLQTESGQREMELSYLTMLPVVKVGETLVEVKTPHGNRFLQAEEVIVFPTEKGLNKGNGQKIVKAVEDFQGLDYFWGGMSAYGYDCSGLAYAAHKANGYQIARDAGDQAKAGEEVTFDKLQTGDLLFFAYEEGKGRLHHVGIYYGNGKMLHSPQTGKGIEIIELAGTVYEKELCAARRYWLETEEK